MYFYETPVLLSRSFREFSRRLGKKWRIFEKNSRIFTKKLKEFCQKLNNPATLSWWWLLKNGQTKSLNFICYPETVDKWWTLECNRYLTCVKLWCHSLMWLGRILPHRRHLQTSRRHCAVSLPRTGGRIGVEMLDRTPRKTEPGDVPLVVAVVQPSTSDG